MLAEHLLIGPHVSTREPLNSGAPGTLAALSDKSCPSVRNAATELLLNLFLSY